MFIEGYLGDNKMKLSEILGWKEKKDDKKL